MAFDAALDSESPGLKKAARNRNVESQLLGFGRNWSLSGAMSRQEQGMRRLGEEWNLYSVHEVMR